MNEEHWVNIYKWSYEYDCRKNDFPEVGRTHAVDICNTALCAGAERYEVTMKNDDSEAATSYITEETSFTVTSLISGGFYDFTVFAIGTRERKNPTGSDALSLQTGLLLVKRIARGLQILGLTDGWSRSHLKYSGCLLTRRAKTHFTVSFKALWDFECILMSYFAFLLTNVDNYALCTKNRFLFHPKKLTSLFVLSSVNLNRAIQYSISK